MNTVRIPLTEENGVSDRQINSTGMYGRVELVTPAMAAAYLATMPAGKQRRLQVRRVDTYSRARRNNNWMLTHQGIGFDTNGELRDGQHRLEMIIRTGLPTILFVVRNVPPDSFLHVDEQLPRTIRDAIRMTGQGDYSCSAVSVARVFYDYPFAERGAYQVPKETIIYRLRLWAKEIDFAETNCQKTVGVTRAARALIVRAAALLPEHQIQRLREFCTILKDGIPVSDNHQEDTAAITYRNFLLRSNTASVALEVEKYQKGQAALTSFLKRQPQRKLYGTELDLFPISEDRQEHLTGDDES